MFSFMVFIVNWYLFNNMDPYFLLKCYLSLEDLHFNTFFHSPTREVPLGGHQPFVSLSTMMVSEFLL